MLFSSSDVVILGVGFAAAALYLFRSSIFPSGSSKDIPNGSAKVHSTDTDVNSRDFVAKMKAAKKRLVIFYGSQTGTAEEYAIRLAKEAKSKFGLASLVCDPEEYDFETLDSVPEDCAVIFVMATYGEGEPTDNAVTLMSNVADTSFEYSKGSHSLEGLKFVVFGLGNRTYEHYNAIARNIDTALEASGAIRIGPRGEGDDDKSMEEDYIEWKDQMWVEFSKVMGVEEGAGAESADFVVSEVEAVDENKVYLGELSARALTKTKGIHDAKNPYPAPISSARELFAPSAINDRNCVHVEFDIQGSGITYQHGDHVGVWPSNPDVEVDRLLFVLGLGAKNRRNAVINIESLDPALAKVPFPVPTTYVTALRHYLDISAVAGRQMLSSLSKIAPSQSAADTLLSLSQDKELYANVVAKGCLKLGEVLQYAAGDDITAVPSASNTTVWNIPFDVIVSALSRLTPRFYSISSSPKLVPNAIHVTCVVLKYQSKPPKNMKAKWVFGVGSNYLLNIKMASHGEQAPLLVENGDANPIHVTNPAYAIAGPRMAYHQGGILRAPIHVRRSTFRLPANPRSPIIMVGPGTGVAPFRGFVQERVALARKALEKNGENALADWGQISLFYGCRSQEDFLYSEEWPGYVAELKGKFKMHTAFSRSGSKKVYVQDLMWEDREHLAKAIAEQKGYIYICGDGHSMSKDVEEKLARILGEAKGGTVEDGVKDVKLLKERSRLLMDVWS